MLNVLRRIDVTSSRQLRSESGKVRKQAQRAHLRPCHCNIDHLVNIVLAGAFPAHSNLKLIPHVSNTGVDDATHSGDADAAHSTFVEASAGRA